MRSRCLNLREEVEVPLPPLLLQAGDRGELGVAGPPLGKETRGARAVPDPGAHAGGAEGGDESEQSVGTDEERDLATRDPGPGERDCSG